MLSFKTLSLNLILVVTAAASAFAQNKDIIVRAPSVALEALTQVKDETDLKSASRAFAELEFHLNANRGLITQACQKKLQDLLKEGRAHANSGRMSKVRAGARKLSNSKTDLLTECTKLPFGGES